MRNTRCWIRYWNDEIVVLKDTVQEQDEQHIALVGNHGTREELDRLTCKVTVGVLSWLGLRATCERIRITVPDKQFHLWLFISRELFNNGMEVHYYTSSSSSSAMELASRNMYTNQ